MNSTDQWNAAVETIAAYFEKKATDSKLGYATTSYDTVAAIVRSYAREPEPPASRLAELETRVRILEERNAVER